MFIPTEPGHYWYTEKGERPIVIDIIIFDNRKPWTYVKGVGVKVEDLPGIIVEGRLEDDMETEGGGNE